MSLPFFLSICNHPNCVLRSKTQYAVSIWGNNEDKAPSFRS